MDQRSDESVATVDSNGIVTAHKYGRAQIICTAYANPEKYAVCDIHTLFRDVDSSSMYFYDPVYWAADNAITVGTGKGKFSPEETCSRAQIVTFLWRMMGEPEVDYDVLFTDVAEDRYFYKAVAWAASTGVTTGTSPTTFSPDESCTRAQIVTFLWRAMGKPEPEADAQFEDVTADRYFYKAVSWAAQNNVTKGTSATRFSPDNKCTRAQAVTFLYRTALLGN